MTGSFLSRRVFEASQDTHANVETSVFCGLLMDGGQSATMLDRHLGQSFPKFEKLQARHAARRRDASSGSLPFLEGCAATGCTTEVR